MDVAPDSTDHDTSTYSILAESKPHATLATGLLTQCRCGVIQYTNTTPIDDPEHEIVTHETTFETTPNSINAFTVLRDSSFRIEFIGTDDRHHLTIFGSLPEAWDWYTTNDHSQITGPPEDRTIESYAGKTEHAADDRYQNLCRRTVRDFIDNCSDELADFLTTDDNDSDGGGTCEFHDDC